MSKQIVTDAGVVTRKGFFKRLFCLHFWHKGAMVLGWPDPLWEHTCLKCGKIKTFRNDPINFIEGGRP